MAYREMVRRRSHSKKRPGDNIILVSFLHALAAWSASHEKGCFIMQNEIASIAVRLSPGFVFDNCAGFSKGSRSQNELHSISCIIFV